MAFETAAAEGAADEAARAAAAATGTAEGMSPEEVEAKARRMGWRPMEEYRGNPDDWKPAAEYLARGLEEYPVLRERYDVLDRRYAKLEGDVSDLRSRLDQASRVVQEVHERNVRLRDTAYARARRDIEAEMRAAVEESDVQRFDAKKQELEELDAEHRDVVATPVRPIGNDGGQRQSAEEPQRPRNPVIENWIADNGWFNRDRVLTDFATSYHGQLKTEQPGLSLEENLRMVTAEVQRRFPEKFSNLRRDDPASVAAPAAPPGKPKPRTYDALPAADKAECDRFIAAFNATNPKTPMTREKWVAAYDWSE